MSYPQRMTVQQIDAEIARGQKVKTAFEWPAKDTGRPMSYGRYAQSQTVLRDLAVKRAGAIKNGYHHAA